MAINSKDKGKRENEVWKPIPGYEGLYEASDMGRIRSLPRNRAKGKILKPYFNKHNGYMYCGLHKDGKSKTKRLHVLIARAFLGMPNNGFDPNCVVDHINGDKTDNRLINLELVTQRENDARARQRIKQTYFSIECIDLDTGEVFKSYTDAAKSVGNGRGEMVRRVCDGERSHYKNHRFARYDDYINGTIPSFKGQYTKKASESLWR